MTDQDGDLDVRDPDETRGPGDAIDARVYPFALLGERSEPFVRLVRAKSRRVACRRPVLLNVASGVGVPEAGGGVIEQSQLFDPDEYRSTCAGHRQVLVEHEDRSEWIDAEIAELVAACWHAGIETIASCQGDAGERAWIWLPYWRETVARFAEVAFDASDASGEWEWTAFPHHVMVRFPRWRLARCRRALRSWEASA